MRLLSPMPSEFQPPIPRIHPARCRWPFAPAAMLNFFRPSELNPSLAGGPCLADAALLANADGLGLGPNGSKCDNTLPFNSAGGGVVVPFGDMDANYSNGSSIYHGFTANLRKRFGNHRS